MMNVFMCNTHRSSVVVKARRGIEVFNDHAGFRRATGIGQPSSNERPGVFPVNDAVAGDHEISGLSRDTNSGQRCKRFPKVVVAFGVRSAGPYLHSTRRGSRSRQAVNLHIRSAVAVIHRSVTTSDGGIILHAESATAGRIDNPSHHTYACASRSVIVLGSVSHSSMLAIGGFKHCALAITNLRN